MVKRSFMDNFFFDRDGKDLYYMRLALQEASKAAEREEVPVGTVIVYGNEVIGRGHNRREELQSPIAHAEILALEDASRNLGSWRLCGCTLYTTLEPCVMCVGGILQARLSRLVFGCLDPKGGAVESLYRLGEDPRSNHHLAVTYGPLEVECAAILDQFFAHLREKKVSAFSVQRSAKRRT